MKRQELPFHKSKKYIMLNKN